MKLTTIDINDKRLVDKFFDSIDISSIHYMEDDEIFNRANIVDNVTTINNFIPPLAEQDCNHTIYWAECKGYFMYFATDDKELIILSIEHDFSSFDSDKLVEIEDFMRRMLYDEGMDIKLIFDLVRL